MLSRYTGRLTVRNDFGGVHVTCLRIITCIYVTYSRADYLRAAQEGPNGRFSLRISLSGTPALDTQRHLDNIEGPRKRNDISLCQEQSN